MASFFLALSVFRPGRRILRIELRIAAEIEPAMGFKEHHPMSSSGVAPDDFRETETAAIEMEMLQEVFST